MAKWIKNDDTVAHTWKSQQVNAGEYYEIQPHEEVAWSNDSTLLVDIGNAVAIVAKDDSGNKDLTDVATGINWLKDIKPEVQKTQQVIADDSLTDRPYGWPHQTATKNTTTTKDFKIEESGLYLRGGIIFTDKAFFGDYVDVQIVDKDGVGVTLGWYDQATFDAMGNLYVVTDYCKDWPVSPSGVTEVKSESVTKDPIPEDLYMRIVYTSVGTVDDVKFQLGIYSYRQ